jgi:two-component system KDP operon response regulator KdpE
VLLAEQSAPALIQLGSHPPDLVILDLMLPDLDGLILLRELRGWSDIPVIVLSARGEEATKIEALDLGADDYLTKPFGIGELLARVRALLRRGKVPVSPRLEFGEIDIDLVNHRVTRNGQEVHLTPTEFDLLAALANNRGKLMTHRQLLQQVWGSYATENVQQLRVYINYLRTKLERDPHAPALILTEPGVGYRLTDDSVPGF